MKANVFTINDKCMRRSYPPQTCEDLRECIIKDNCSIDQIKLIEQLLKPLNKPVSEKSSNFETYLSDVNKILTDLQLPNVQNVFSLGDLIIEILEILYTRLLSLSSLYRSDNDLTMINKFSFQLPLICKTILEKKDNLTMFTTEIHALLNSYNNLLMYSNPNPDPNSKLKLIQSSNLNFDPPPKLYSSNFTEKVHAQLNKLEQLLSDMNLIRAQYETLKCAKGKKQNINSIALSVHKLLKESECKGSSHQFTFLVDERNKDNPILFNKENEQLYYSGQYIEGQIDENQIKFSIDFQPTYSLTINIDKSTNLSQEKRFIYDEQERPKSPRMLTRIASVLSSRSRSPSPQPLSEIESSFSQPPLVIGSPTVSQTL